MQIDPDKIRKILVIRLSALGDVINCLPVIAALKDRFPRVFIGFAVEEGPSDLLTSHPYIDQLFIFRKKRWFKSRLRIGEAFSYWRSIRRERFDICLDLQGNLKGSFHTLASGAKYRIGFGRRDCYEFNYLFTNIHVKPNVKHRVDKFVSVLKPLGISNPSIDFKLPAIDGIASASNYIVVHPGTSEFGSEKKWAPERFAKLSRILSESLDIDVLITWGPDEFELAKTVKELSDTTRVNMAQRTESLLDLAQIIKHAKLFVSADTGPMHLADALGTPTICLFGPKDPAVYGPYKCRNKIIWEPSGMHNITVDQVFNEARTLVS